MKNARNRTRIRSLGGSCGHRQTGVRNRLGSTAASGQNQKKEHRHVSGQSMPWHKQTV
jgi:hypothetical protein